MFKKFKTYDSLARGESEILLNLLHIVSVKPAYMLDGISVVLTIKEIYYIKLSYDDVVMELSDI